MRTGICCYCGKEGPVTREHVPPKSFFPASMREGVNLITVSCCAKCNNDKSPDDEKMRNHLAVLMKGISEAATIISGQAEKALLRDAKKRKDFLKQIFPLNAQRMIYIKDDFWESQIKSWAKGLFSYENDSKWIGMATYEIVMNKGVCRDNLLEVIVPSMLQMNNAKKVVIVDEVFWYVYIPPQRFAQNELIFLIDVFNHLNFTVHCTLMSGSG